MANHAKHVVHSSRYATPRLILKRIPAITREAKKTTLLITPRIFDISDDDGAAVGRSLGTSSQNFIKLGRILDAVGVSNPNAKNVELEKIIIEPQNSNFNVHSPKFLNTFKNILRKIRIENVRNGDPNFVGHALNTLDDAKAKVGANSIKDFLVKMKQDFQQVLPRMLEKSRKPVDKPKDTETVTSQHRFRRSRTADDQRTEQDIRVGAGLYPEELLHPFMGHVTGSESRQSTQEHNVEGVTVDHQDKTDQNLGQLLGAINPMMFERIFNETLTIKDGGDTPHAMFHHHHDGRSHGHHETEDKVSTSMAIKGPISKPFMGQASDKMKEDFLHKPSQETPHYTGYEHSPESTQWVEIFHPYPEYDLEYDV